MATQYGIQPSFSRGELTPRLHARVDYDGWRSGLAECFNFVVMRQGGLRRRPGFRYTGMAKKQALNDVVRLVRFEFAPGQSYALELGDAYMRVFALGGQVLSGGVPYEIVTPWAAADIRDLQFAQSYDVIYVTHRAYPPTKIQRLGETNWTIAAVDFEDGPYLEINSSGTQLSPQGTGDLVPLLTADSSADGEVTLSNEEAGFEGFRAFDRFLGTEWRSLVPAPAYIQYAFPGGGAKVVSGYAIRASLQVAQFAETVGSTTTIYKIPGGLRAPRAWTFEGTDDGVNYTVLDTQANQTGWGDGERRYYSFTNKVAYKGYRLSILAGNQSERPIAIADLSFQGSGPDVQNVIFLTDDITKINAGAGFTSADIGRHLRFLSEDAYWHWFKIIDVVSTTQIETELRSPPLPNGKSSNSWRLGAFSPQTGYPKAVGFYLGGRLCYGGTIEKPQTVYGSQTDNFDSFAISSPIKADDAFTFTFGEVGEIQWLTDAGDLMVGTTAAIRSLGAADKTQGFSATNVSQGRPARTGAAAIQPLPTGAVPVFVGRFRDTIREATYSQDGAGYAAPDISVLSEHLLKPGIRELGYAQDPNALIWASMENGSLVGMTYEKDQQMVAMHGHAVGGGGFVESMCVLSGADRHELWAVVRRTRPNDTVMRTVERMAADFEKKPQAEAYYLDCGLTYSGAATTTVTGLSHLNGFEVSIMADGATEPNATVTGGSLTLPSGRPASMIHIGFSYDSRGRTLRIAQGGGDGSGLGRKKRIKKVMPDVLETGQLKAKASRADYTEMVIRRADTPMGSPPPLVTGKLGPMTVDDSWEGEGVASFVSDGPQPATIRAFSAAFDGEP